MKRRLLPILTASLLVACGDTEPTPDLWTAAATGDCETIERHVARGADLDVVEPMGGSTPLITAAVFGHDEAIQVLTTNGADLDLTNNDGSTALHVAAFFGHIEATEWLLKQGADHAVKNRYGRTALESVAGPWSEGLEAAYTAVAAAWGLELDLERIREVRPQIAALIAEHTGR